MSDDGPTVLGVRHGEVHNPEGVIYAGLPGYGLSDAGRRQAKDLAGALRGLPVTALYSSPLERAMETAEILGEATGAEIVPDERLYEWRHWQQWAGMTWEELRTEGREAWEAYQADPASVTSGESIAELGDRMTSWLDEVLERHDRGIVVGVAHLEPLRTILLRRTGRPATDLFDVRVGLCECVRLHPDPDPTPATPGELLGGG